ncbi:MAG: hypothetical protein KAQ83_02855 [Nanoarchaeota archaeon]|nr:hypothetical protein [Nanoarchaeota archaeon]
MKHHKHKNSIFTITNIVIAILAIALIFAIFTKGFTNPINLPFSKKAEITETSFLILTDERCTGQECNTEQITTTLEQMFPEFSYQIIDYNSKQGNQLYEELELTTLPAILFSPEIKETENYNQIGPYTEEKGEYINLLIGATYDPNPEVCDNGKDDNDNDLVDCDDADCSSSVECSKTDKPEVELFIWSYCPYGVMAQGPMAEVANILAGKADFKAIMYHDGHGAYETQQNQIQACIQKLDPNNYWSYSEGFVSDIYPVCGQSKDIECDLAESVKLMNSLSIDSNGILACVTSYGTDLIKEDLAHAQENGVTGSPTIIINGVRTQVARTPAAILDAVCSAFNDQPEECNSEVSANAEAQAPAGGSC